MTMFRCNLGKASAPFSGDATFFLKYVQRPTRDFINCPQNTVRSAEDVGTNWYSYTFRPAPAYFFNYILRLIATKRSTGLHWTW